MRNTCTAPSSGRCTPPRSPTLVFGAYPPTALPQLLCCGFCNDQPVAGHIQSFFCKSAQGVAPSLLDTRRFACMLFGPNFATVSLSLPPSLPLSFSLSPSFSPPAPPPRLPPCPPPSLSVSLFRSLARSLAPLPPSNSSHSPHPHLAPSVLMKLPCAHCPLSRVRCVILLSSPTNAAYHIPTDSGHIIAPRPHTHPLHSLLLAHNVC